MYRPHLIAILACLMTLAACGNDAREDGADVGADAGVGDVGGSDTGGTDAGGTDTGGTDTGGTDTGGSLPEPENHRPAPEACDDERPLSTDWLPDPETMPGMDCYAHEDCTEGRNGRCSDMGRGWWQCTYDQCLDDDGCAGGGVCSCGGGWGSDANACLPGNCQVDADCGEGSWCSPSFGDCGDYSGVVAYYCRTPDDQCLNDSGCVDPEQGPGYCMYSESAGYWLCSYSHCVG